MRLLRGVAGRVLPCGCLIGVYETYEGRIVDMIDARGPDCADPAHELHAVITRGSITARHDEPPSTLRSAR